MRTPARRGRSRAGGGAGARPGRRPLHHPRALRSLRQDPALRPGFQSTNDYNTKAFQVNYTHTFSPRDLNEASFGFGRVEGTNVNAGDPLFKLDDKPYQERLKAAKGMLGEAQASLRKYQADVSRLKPLADKHAVPKQDLDNALAAVATVRRHGPSPGPCEKLSPR